MGYRISTATGTYDSDDFEEILFRQTDLLVVTPEKLDLLLRAQPEFLENVRLFVLDEAHIVHDSQRGIKFELLLTRLKRKLHQARFIVLSTVVPQETLLRGSTPRLTTIFSLLRGVHRSSAIQSLNSVVKPG